MGRPDDCARLTQEGESPSDIALDLGISTSSVIQYLFVAIGKHKIRLSDVLMSIPAPDRSAIDEAVEACGTDYWFKVNGQLLSNGIQLDREELQLYLWNRPSLVGEMYVFLSDLERTLHEKLQALLKSVFPTDSMAWWDQGVPSKIRTLCQSRHDKDPAPSGHPYQYTDFGHIKTIFERNWPILSPWLPEDEASQKEALFRDLENANGIRNRVMHPVHRYTPSEEELAFIRALSSRLALSRWPHSPRTKTSPGDA